MLHTTYISDAYIPFFLFSVSLRNVGELAGVLSRTYVPSLDGDSKKQRSTYGNDRFDFPANYRNDENEGVFVGYRHNGMEGNEREEDEENEEEEEADEVEEDNHRIVSLIASEIFQRRQKEMEALREEQRLDSEMEEERIRVLRLVELQSIALGGVSRKGERDQGGVEVFEGEDEIEDETENMGEKEMEDDVEKEVEVEEDTQMFWDSLLLKPISSGRHGQPDRFVDNNNDNNGTGGYNSIETGSRGYSNSNINSDGRSYMDNIDGSRDHINNNDSDNYDENKEKDYSDPINILRNIPGEYHSFCLLFHAQITLNSIYDFKTEICGLQLLFSI